MALSLLLGAAAGFAAGYAVAGRKKKTTAEAVLRCGPTEGSQWVTIRGLAGYMVTRPGDAQLMLPMSRGGTFDDSEFPIPPDVVIVAMENCSVYTWEGTVETGNWTLNPALTADFQSVLQGAQVRFTPSRPPEGFPPEPGPRLVPGF